MGKLSWVLQREPILEALKIHLRNATLVSLMKALGVVTQVDSLRSTQVWIYVTHFVTERRKWYREISEVYEHLGEWRTGVGKPRFAHPINNVLWNAVSLPVQQIHIRIISNRKIDTIDEIFRSLVASRLDGSTIENLVDGPPDKNDPFTLTWQHKKYLASDLVQASSNAIFVYLEHDQLLSSTNLEYFIQANQTLELVHLAPEFLRCEWHSQKKNWTLTDVTDLSTMRVVFEPEIKIGYVKMSNEYCGFYVMNLAMARRHQNLPTSSLKTIRTELPYPLHEKLKHLRSAELAALGSRFDHWLCSANRETIPMSNHVILLAPNLKTIDWRCLSWHVSNNYAKVRRFRRSPYGQISVRDISF